MKLNNNKSIILLSGGLDSFISLVLAKEEFNIKLALTFDYGQKSAKQEIESSKKIADYYNIEHKIIELPWLANITKTSLVNTEENIPMLDSSELDNKQKTENSAKNVWVPNRNGLFLNVAGCFADSMGFSHIIFGANKEEASTFPDNSIEFVERINSALALSTRVVPKVVAPLANFDKKAIIKLGLELQAPLSMLRSCYSNESKHCGKCESCLRLKRALEANGKDLDFIES